MALGLGSLLAPLLYIGSKNALHRFTQVDDPLEILAIHVVPAFFSLLLAPVFHWERGLAFAPSRDGLWVLAFNVAGAFTLAAWSALLSFFLFGSLAACGGLTREEKGQIKGKNAFMREEYPGNICTKHCM